MKKLIEKFKNNKPQAILGIFTFALVGAFILTRIFAAGADVSLSSSTTAVAKGDTFEVTVLASTGATQVSIGQAYVSFDPAKVEYVSTDVSGSAFDTKSPEDEVGNGYVKISRFKFPPPPYPSGNIEIGTITFRMLADSGSVDIAVGGAGVDTTYLADANDASNIVTTTAGTTINVQTPEPDPVCEDNAANNTGEALPCTYDPDPTPISLGASLSADKSTIAKDETVKITYTINAGSNDISIGKGYISYDPSQFVFVSRDYAGSSLSVTMANEELSGSGFVTVARYSQPPFPSGNVVVGSVVLRAIADSANATINIDNSNSEIYIGSTGQLAGLNGTGINVVISTPTNPNPDPVCEDNAANNTGEALPCTYDPAPVCEDNAANNTGEALPCTYDQKPPPIILPVTPGGGTPPPNVPRGTTVVPQVPKTTSTGQSITNTDYYLNGQYQGSSTGVDNPVEINTENLAPGTYDITARSTAKDGSTEESTQSFKLKDDAIMVKYRLPIVLAASSILAIIVGLILKSLFSSAIPFYRTLK